MSLVRKYRRGHIWYLDYSELIGKPRRSLHTSDTRLAETIRAKEENDYIMAIAGVRVHPGASLAYTELVRQFLVYKDTRNISEGMMKLYIRTFNAFGATLRDDLKSAKINRMHIEHYMTGRDVSGKTIRNEISILHSLFSWAVRQRLLSENPCLGIELPKVKKQFPAYLTPAQYVKLANSIHNEYDRALLQFYILTGCRRSEATAIEMKLHVDMGKRILVIPQQKQGDFRTVYINDDLLAVVNRLVERSGKFLIPMNHRRIYKRLRKHFDYAGLKHIHLHSLRHTFGTWMASRGASSRTLQELMGHRDSRSTQVYTHALNKSLQAEMKKHRLPRR